jgi:murein DD-endopeptidase MepM/ murein hydrolase activator NlpD
MKPVRLAFFVLLVIATAADAQMRGKRMGGGDGDTTDGIVERREAVIEATGLSPVFQEGFACEPVSSPYGSPTRYDGSLRRMDRNGGLHGGMDITLPDGTPLLAVANGEVIAKGEGGLLEGIFLWLRIAPKDSGLPLWTFAKYQHLSALPTLEIGARVTAGQVVALSGGTGTAGGHYGAAGYSHLHLSTYFGPSGDFAVMGIFQSMVKGAGAVSSDPLRLYLPGGELPADTSSRAVPVPIVRPDGTAIPAGSKTVWPVACQYK